MSSSLPETVVEPAAPVHGVPAMGRLPRQLSTPEMQLFASVGQRQVLAPGQAVFRRGEFGRSMFVIESGRILLEFAGDLPDKLIGPDEYFGELALFVGSHARSGSALASEPSVVYLVDPDAFEQLLQREPLQMARFMLRSFTYLVASEQQLIGNYKRRNEDLMQTLDSLRQTRDQLQLARRQVCTDDLTGLSNRRGLYKFLEDAGDHRDGDRHFGLLLIDVDHFKQINDQNGHLVGDEVLRAIASEIQSAGRVTDLPCRLGGDEFALLTQVSDQQELNERALSIVKGVRQLRFSQSAPKLVVSISVGGGMCREDGEWSVWYSEADSALYHVKGAGGDDAHVLG
ncbi:MAG TPA: GGDEF domain-containing protein [Rhodanobacteraceae bacterium]|nr:GGDEF domain-containing protein [Rhodanobacteraceae bacterium]